MSTETEKKQHYLPCADYCSLKNDCWHFVDTPPNTEQLLAIDSWTKVCLSVSGGLILSKCLIIRHICILLDLQQRCQPPREAGWGRQRAERWRWCKSVWQTTLTFPETAASWHHVLILSFNATQTSTPLVAGFLYDGRYRHT